MSRPSFRQSGFSLVELLVTALIFAIGLLGLAALQVSTARSNSGGRNRVTATSLAEGCLSAIQAEGSMSWSFAAGALGTASKFAGTRVFTGGTANNDFGFFDINGQPVVKGDPTQVFQVAWVRLNPTAATPSQTITNMNLNEFVVTVTWTDQAKAADGTDLTNTQRLVLSRLIRYGVQP
jgi:prepilin-type N-terminal cleavage/methylation domain-containing protein